MVMDSDLNGSLEDLSVAESTATPVADYEVEMFCLTPEAHDFVLESNNLTELLIEAREDIYWRTDNALENPELIDDEQWRTLFRLSLIRLNLIADRIEDLRSPPLTDTVRAFLVAERTVTYDSLGTWAANSQYSSASQQSDQVRVITIPFRRTRNVTMEEYILTLERVCGQDGLTK